MHPKDSQFHAFPEAVCPPQVPWGPLALTLGTLGSEGGLHHAALQRLRVPVIVAQGAVVPVQQGVLQELDLGQGHGDITQDTGTAAVPTSAVHILQFLRQESSGPLAE